MNTDVFISYCTRSSLHIVEKVVQKLEENGIRCWYASRDSVGFYAEHIMKAIKNCTVFLLMLDREASESSEVLNELHYVTERMKEKEPVMIVPFHIADEKDDMSLESRYYLDRLDWFDGCKPPLYQRIDELAAKIKQLLDSPMENIVKTVPSQHIVSNLPQPGRVFAGRDNLLKQIEQNFQSGERVVFLEGIGGIGKSELAVQYAIRHKNKYSNIIFTVYSGSIKQMVCDPSMIQIEGIEQRTGEDSVEFFHRKIHVFRSLADEKTLLIIDNFDTDNDPDLEVLLNGVHNVLLTSRNRHPDRCSIAVSAIENLDVMIQIFNQYCSGLLEPEDRPYIEKLLSKIQYHTYAVELLAKQMEAGFLNGRELLELFEKEGLDSEKMTECIQGRSGQDHAFNHICSVFSISGLTEDEKQILREMSLAGAFGIPARQLKEWAGLSSFDIINGLIRKSWIRREGGRQLCLHPLVAAVIRKMLIPDTQNCGDFLERMAQHLYWAWYRTSEENMALSDVVLETAEYLKPFDPEKMDIWHTMTAFLWQTGKFEDSVRLQREVYETCSKAFGEAHMITGFAAKALGGCLFNSGRLKESAPWYIQGLRSMELALKQGSGQENEDLAMAYEKVARCFTWDFMRDFEKSKKYLERALEIRLHLKQKMENGEHLEMFEHWETYDLNKCYERIAETYMETGRMYQIAQQYEKALEYAQRQQKILEQFCPDNPSTQAYVLYDRGICHYHIALEYKNADDVKQAEDEMEKAVICLKKAVEINRKMRGDQAVDTVDTVELLADAYMEQGRFSEASKCYRDAANMAENLFGPVSERVGNLKRKLNIKNVKIVE